MIGRNIIANYGGSAVTSLLSLALVPVYIRYLGIEAYALVGLFAVIQAWLTLLDFGMTPTLGREMARFSAGAQPVQGIRDLLRTLEILALAVSAVIIIAMVGASDYLANHWLDARTLSADAIAQAIVIMSIVVAARFCEAMWRSALFGLQQQYWYNIVNAAMSLFRYGGAALIVAFVSPTTLAFFAWQLLASLLMLALLGVKLYRCLPQAPRAATFSVAALSDIKAFAAGMIGINLLAVLLTQVDKLLLSRLIPLDQFGYYMLAVSVCAMIYALTAPVTQALSPPIVEAATRGDSITEARLYHGGAQLISVMVAPVVLMLIGFGHDALFVWTGDAQLTGEVAPLLALLAIGTMLSGLMQLPYFTMIAHGWTRLSLVSNMVAVAVMVPLLLIVVPVHGGRGAAMVWIMLNLGYLLVQVPLLHRRILRGEMWRWYGQDVALPLLAAAIVTVIAVALRGQLTLSRWQLLPVLGLAWGMAALAAAMVAPAVRHRLYGLVGRMLARGAADPDQAGS
jgi:O-antigen/teichoic acid export membrane protein